MGIFDRFLGETPAPGKAAPETPTTDEAAIQRYRYLLRTAPPEAIEQAHAEAFAQLTPEQRTQILRELHQGLPEAERRAAPNQADPQTLARMATRAEVRQPGVLERTFGGGTGMGMGGMIGSSLLGSIAGTFIGTAIAHQFLGGEGGGHSALGEEGASNDASESTHAEGVDESVQEEGDMGGDDFGGDFGGDDI